MRRRDGESLLRSSLTSCSAHPAFDTLALASSTLLELGRLHSIFPGTHRFHPSPPDSNADCELLTIGSFCSSLRRALSSSASFLVLDDALDDCRGATGEMPPLFFRRFTTSPLGLSLASAACTSTTLPPLAGDLLLLPSLPPPLSADLLLLLLVSSLFSSFPRFSASACKPSLDDKAPPLLPRPFAKSTAPPTTRARALCPPPPSAPPR